VVHGTLVRVKARREAGVEALLLLLRVLNPLLDGIRQFLAGLLELLVLYAPRAVVDRLMPLHVPEDEKPLALLEAGQLDLLFVANVYQLTLGYVAEVGAG